MGLVSTKPIGREDQIRTGDPLHPIQVRYRAALHPDLMFDLAETESPGGNAHGNGSPFKGLQRYKNYYSPANQIEKPRTPTTNLPLTKKSQKIIQQQPLSLDSSPHLL